jgi:hypothetical protein
MRAAELPTFEATWWPLSLETVPGSDERIAVAVVVRASSGQSQARQLITPVRLSALFGSAAAGMRALVVQTVASLQRQLDEGVPVEELQMPFGGMGFGAPRDCVAHDLNEVFEVAFRLGGAFGASTFGVAEKPSDDTRRAFDEWAQSIRLELLGAEATADLGESFDVRVQLSTGKQGRFNFLNDAYAANFGVLRPGRSTSGDLRGLKVKLFDLEALKRSSLLTRRAELLIGAPALQAGSPYSSREIETQRASWEFIDFEAKQRGVKALRYALAGDAAAHLGQQVHAR